MKKRFTVLLLFVGACLWGQAPPCLPSVNGIPGGNEPPGCFMCGPVYKGSTKGYTSFWPNDIATPCGISIENNQFFSVDPGPGRWAKLQFLITNSAQNQGVEVVFLDQFFTPLTDCFLFTEDTLSELIELDNLLPFDRPLEDVWVMVDGIDGDIVDFILIAETWGGEIPDPTPPIMADIQKDFYSVGEEVCFSVVVSPSRPMVEWTIPKSAEVISGGGILDNEVCLKFTNSGKDTLRANNLNDCFPGFPNLLEFEVFDVPNNRNEPPADLFEGCKYLGNFEGLTPSDSVDQIFPCGTVDFGHWIAVKPNELGEITLQSKILSCPNSVVCIEGIFLDTDLRTVSNCFSFGTNCNENFFNVGGLNKDSIYYLLLDPSNSDLGCSFEIRFEHQAEIPVSSQLFKINKDNPCIGEEVSLSISPIPLAEKYYWNIPWFAEIIEGGGLQDTFITIKHENSRTTGVTVTLANSCYSGSTIDTLVRFRQVTVPDQTPIYFCPEDNAPIDSFIVYQTADGCDSIVRFSCIPKSAIPYQVDLFLCPDQCFEANDSCYSSSERIVLNDAKINGCDSVIILNLEQVNALPAPTINCHIGLDTINLTWNQNSINDGYLIEIQGVIVDTLVNQTSYDYRLSPNDSLIQFRVIPFGNASCPYEIGEITCDLRTTSIATTFHESGLKIHPNPTNGQVLIESKSLIENVTVFDISGRKVMTSQQANVSLEAQPPGMYFFKVEMKEGVVVRRIIKN